MVEVRARVRAELRRRLPATATAADVEAASLQLAREMFGPVIGEELTARAAEAPRDERCVQCGHKLRLVDAARARQLTGILGESRYTRAYLHCGHCRQGYVPADQLLGLGPGAWLPSLLEAAARLGIEVPFAQAASALAEAVHLPVPEEDVRRATEGIGAVAEAEQQAAIAKAERSEEQPGLAAADTLAVAVDGCMVHVDGAWHEAKVAVCAPCGPEVETDPDTGRKRLALGQQHFAVGLEDAERFWYRTYALAVARGLGGRQVRHVVALGDGAEWIWNRAKTFFGVPGVEVIEIVDIWHARQYVWKVGNAVFGQGTAEAVAWAEPLCAVLRDEGATPVLAALGQLAPEDADGADAVRLGLEYFGGNASRMRYPEFAAAGLPVGSGMVEGGCKQVVQAREKGTGMRWRRKGAQAVASLRAIHRSGQWARFWARQPQMRRPTARSLRSAA